MDLNSKKNYQGSGNEKESRCRVFTSFGEREIRQKNAKKCTKKRDARAKLLFCLSKPFAFLPFSLTSPSSLLQLPIDNPEGGTVCNLIAGDKRSPHS